MRIAITGSKGQLGTALQAILAEEDLLLIDLPEDDITDYRHIRERITDFAPDVVIHGAAYTNVDGCEEQPELAYRANTLGSRNVALACQACDAAMVCISTDYVFDGLKGEPYWEFDDPHPLSVYAHSKLAGERMVQSLLQRYYIVRTAWLYSKSGNNFVNTVLRLADQRDELHMVTDEAGSPTYAPDLAEAVAKLIHHPAYGIYHFTNQGTCSRFDWARRVLDLAGKPDYRLLPSTNYKRLAKVPAQVEIRNFCGATLGITLRSWSEALEDFFK